jgi:hypothetical protein
VEDLRLSLGSEIRAGAHRQRPRRGRCERSEIT